MGIPSSLLATALRKADGLILVVSGAGISSASGIPTFRGPEPEAVWKVSDVEMATWSYFQSDPVGQWTWYLDRFRKVDSALPNPAHSALADLERWQERRNHPFLLVTQNIDTLHEAAGSRSLIKVHGTSDRLRCTRPGCRKGAPVGSVPRTDLDLDAFSRDPSNENLPRCPECNALLRAHVLFFDEYYQEHHDYRFRDVMRAAEEASLMLFVGTSFSVGITDMLLRVAYQHQTPTFSIDPGGSRIPAYYRVTAIPEPAESVLPDTIQLLAG